MIDEGSNFENALKMGLEILRKLVLVKNWETASKLNQNYLNKLITNNTEFIRSLTDEDKDLEIKSMLREKELLASTIDAVGLFRSYTRESVRVNLISGSDEREASG
jgi:hypothetical protein